MTLKQAAIGLILLGAVGASAYIAYDHFADRPVGTQSVVATVAPAASHEPTTLTTIKAPVKAYGGTTKARLKLPAAVQADSKEQVIAASQVKSDLRPQTVSTVVNTETGEVTSYVKTDPYPWLAIETRGEVKLAYGYKYTPSLHQTLPVGRLQVSYDVLRVKALTLGVTASADTDSTAFVGVAVSYKF